MKKTPEISSVESKVFIPVMVLENYMNKTNREDILDESAGINRVIRNGSFENIGWRSAHSPVKGTVEINFTESRNNFKSVSLPVCSTFLVTCTRNNGGMFQVTWSLSLS
jgi:hypothetical protein